MKKILVTVALSAMVVQPTLAVAEQAEPASSPNPTSVPSQAPTAGPWVTGDATLSTAFDLTAPSPGYTYFYRSGATIEDHDVAVRNCRRQAVRMAQPEDPSTAAAGAAGGLLGAVVMGVVSGYIRDKRNSRALGANLENCMVVEGWTVRSIAAPEGEVLDKLEQPALHEAIALRVAAAEPQDEQVRVFGNELKHRAPAAFGWAGDMDAQSLSLQALPPVAKEDVADPRPRLPRQPRSARSPRALTEAQLVAAPETALVIVKLKGLVQHAGRSLTFVRAGEDADTPAWVADQQPDRFVAGLTYRAAVRGDANRFNTVAFAIPAGRWRLTSVTKSMFSLSLCRGAPAFDVQAGQVVFLGEFDMGGGVAMPNMNVAEADLPPAYAALAPMPVEWADGGVSTCEGAYLYAALREYPKNEVIQTVTDVAVVDEVTTSGEPLPTAREDDQSPLVAQQK